MVIDDRAQGREGGSRWRGLRAACACVALVGSLRDCRGDGSARRVTIGYVEIAGDPRHEPVTGLWTRGPQEPCGRSPGHSWGSTTPRPHARARSTLRSSASACPRRVESRRPSSGARCPRHPFLHRRCPGRGLPAAGRHHQGPRHPGLQRHRSGRRAATQPSAEVVHTLPSLAMSMDGLVQYLVSRNGPIFCSEGPLRADAVMVGAFESSARNSAPGWWQGSSSRRARIRASGKERSRAAFRHQPRLRCGVRRRSRLRLRPPVPYATVRARPVVGSIDLEPSGVVQPGRASWRAAGEFSVPATLRGRRMESADWAAWMAVKMVVQATCARSRWSSRVSASSCSATPGRRQQGLAVAFVPGTTRLRQAILLASPYSVVARAPVEGFLHRTNALDTLGDDEPESSCRMTGSRHADRTRWPGAARRHHPGNRQVRAAARAAAVGAGASADVARGVRRGFYNVFGVSIIPPYQTYITYQVYIVPGLLGIILLFHGMQSSLSMV